MSKTFLKIASRMNCIKSISNQGLPSDILFSDANFQTNLCSDWSTRKTTTTFRFGHKYGDGTFFATYWKPAFKPESPARINALVFISHGYSGYLGTDFEAIARRMSEEINGGCLVFGHDHLGHGRTTAGERALVNNMEDYTEPIIAHIKAIQNLIDSSERKLPVFLVGHSMGALIAIFCILNQPHLFKGFITIGPLIKLHPDLATYPKMFLAKLVQRVWPTFSLPAWMEGIDKNRSTRRKAFVDEMKEDKLRYHGGTKAGTAWFLFQNCIQAQENLSKLIVPILILQGGMDKVTDPAGAKMLYENVSSTDKEYKEYEEALHQLLMELDDVKDDTEKRIVNWINQRLNICPQ